MLIGLPIFPPFLFFLGGGGGGGGVARNLILCLFYIGRCESWVARMLDTPELFAAAVSPSSRVDRDRAYLPGAFMVDEERTDMVAGLLEGLSQMLLVQMQSTATRHSFDRPISHGFCLLFFLLGLCQPSCVV